MLPKIIDYAPSKMEEMLKSVYNYNSSFSYEKLEKILFAMSVIDRKFFYEEKEAYYDTALPIGSGQTISQPSTVARMLLLADLQENEDVLEVGAGSGWNACLIAFLVYPGTVLSVDRIRSLIEKAEKNVANLKNHLEQTRPQDVEKIKIRFLAENIFDKKRCWKKRYDKIIITAGISNKKTEKKIEELAKSLLKKNGVLICPYTSGPLIIYRKKDQLKREETKEHYIFVPLLEGTE